jgi:hydroxymethylbilane synthase
VTAQATLRIGTRGSRLALAQARLVQRALARNGGAELVEVRTHGDAISERHARGGFEATDGQFTAELEKALGRCEVDLAVHSYKDLPTQPAAGLLVAAVPSRGDARDCLLSREGGGLDGLPHGARVGTSSVRRARQLLHERPDLRVEPMRGNVETRIARMRSGEYDGVLLACAGLDRLGIPVPDEARLPFELMLPAPAQAALAIQARTDRPDLVELLAPLEDGNARLAVEAERALLRSIGGGCLAPLGVLGEVAHGRLRLRATYFPDGAAAPAMVDLSAPVDEVDGLVADAARRLAAAGNAS